MNPDCDCDETDVVMSHMWRNDSQYTSSPKATDMARVSVPACSKLSSAIRYAYDAMKERKPSNWNPHERDQFQVS